MLRPSRIRVVRNQRMSATISEKITGTGIPITLAAKKFTKSNEKPYTELASEITSVIPRKIALVPRVMMNGCSPVQLTEQPLIAPVRRQPVHRQSSLRETGQHLPTSVWRSPYRKAPESRQPRGRYQRPDSEKLAHADQYRHGALNKNLGNIIGGQKIFW